MGKGRTPGRPMRPPRREERPHKINREIRVPEVRLVGVKELGIEGLEDGVFPTSRAISLAEELELDLVEIAPQITPPVCRIVEYSKFRYEQKKREKINKAKQATVVMKEIRFGPNTDDHDFNFKINHAKRFLEENNKVKVYVQFHGRTIVYKDRGLDILTRFAQELEDVAKIEAEAKMEGRRMIMILTPGKKGK